MLTFKGIILFPLHLDYFSYISGLSLKKVRKKTKYIYPSSRDRTQIYSWLSDKKKWRSNYCWNSFKCSRLLLIQSFFTSLISNFGFRVNLNRGARNSFKLDLLLRFVRLRELGLIRLRIRSVWLRVLIQESFSPSCLVADSL